MTDKPKAPKSIPSKAAAGFLADDFAVETFDDLAHLPADELRGQLDGWLQGWQTLMAAVVLADSEVWDSFASVLDEHAKERMTRALRDAQPEMSEDTEGAQRLLAYLAALHRSSASVDVVALTDYPDMNALVTLPEADRRALVQALDSGTQRVAAALQGADETVRAAFLEAMTPDEIDMVVEQFRDRTFTEEEIFAACERIRSDVEHGAELEKEWAEARNEQIEELDEQCRANVEVIWRFLRGDMETADFECWLYSEPDLETELGDQFYLEVISVDYANKRALGDIKASLEAYAEQRTSRHCECLTVGDFYRFSTNLEWEDIFKAFEKRAERGEPFWWISTYECAACLQGWLVGCDPDEYEFILKRLSPTESKGIIEQDRWPKDFDNFEILQTGRLVDDPPQEAHRDLQSFEDLATFNAEEMRAVMNALFFVDEGSVLSIAATPEGDKTHAIAAAFSGASQQIRDAMIGVLTETEAQCFKDDITAGTPSNEMVLAAQAAILEVARQPDRYTPPKRFEPSESQIREAEEHQDEILKGLGKILKD